MPSRLVASAARPGAAPCRSAMQDDPYPFYRRLRIDDPVHWDAAQQLWLVTRYADVIAGLRDHRLSSQRCWEDLPIAGAVQATALQVQQAYAQQILFRDGPDHTRLRRVMVTAFTPRVVDGLRPLIARLVDDMLERAAARGQMDVIADLAYPLPTAVIAAVLGLPQQDMERFKAWSAAMATTYAQDITKPLGLAHAYRRVSDLLDYMGRLVEQRRRAPQNDLMHTLIAACDDEHVLRTEEVVANCVLLLFAGHETTTNLIGNGLLALLRHPDQLRRLRADPTLFGSAVEELLRYDCPVQVAGRLATEDLEIGGRRIGAGQYVALSLGAANRDPAQFPAPDRLDVGRVENRHLAFAYGPHFCLGAALARLEGQIALKELVCRWPHLRLAEDTVRWRDTRGLRGLEALPVHLGPSSWCGSRSDGSMVGAGCPLRSEHRDKEIA